MLESFHLESTPPAISPTELDWVTFLMSFALRREKKLPDIPVDIDASGAVVGDEGLYSIPSSEIATSTNTDKALPSINVEKTLSKDEISRLHELWNEAGLSAVITTCISLTVIG